MLLTQFDRRKAFKKALIDHELTARQFAEQQGVKEHHLHAVLTGRRLSGRLMKEITALIEASKVHNANRCGCP